MPTDIIPYAKLKMFCEGITALCISEIAQTRDRAEIDGIIHEYLGFIRTITRAMDYDDLMVHRSYRATRLHRALAKLLREQLAHEKRLHPTNNKIGFAVALKLAYTKLSYDETKDITY